MTEEFVTDPRDSLKLKLAEPDVVPESPWSDDVLGRAQVAESLTNLIRHESSPFVISIHGYWGTGKTFLLKRWQKDLETQQFKAIYFNAWEDDFCDDPLLAILGQLAGYFKDGTHQGLANRIFEIAIPLIRQNALSLLSKTTGLVLPVEGKEPDQRNFLEEYLGQRATKDQLKEHLTEMSAAVAVETEQPMVIIIDELDRCRPTFAVELLERVKHLFDVPNLVFVFGINRDELCSSLQSIYGNINADVYLRRFFDMEFTLPEADSKKFSTHLMERFKLAEFFAALDESSDVKVHLNEFQAAVAIFPALWSSLGLSLRDIDYCVRLFSVVGKNIQVRQYMYPLLLGLLITLKLDNLTLYRQLVQGTCRGSQVMDYINSKILRQRMDVRLPNALAMMEAYLYLTEYDEVSSEINVETALGQLNRVKNGEPLDHPEYLSKRTRDLEAAAAAVNGAVERLSRSRVWADYVDLVNYLAGLIDLHQDFVRR